MTFQPRSLYLERTHASDVNLLFTKLPRSSNELKLKVYRRQVLPSVTIRAVLTLCRYPPFISAPATLNPRCAITAVAGSETQAAVCLTLRAVSLVSDGFGSH